MNTILSTPKDGSELVGGSKNKKENHLGEVNINENQNLCK
jgi:hypothetical protein